MTKFQKNFGIVLLIGLALTLDRVVYGDLMDEPAAANQIRVKQPNDIKIYIEDHSRVLSKEEVDKLSNKDSIPIVTPLKVQPAKEIEPKLSNVVNEIAQQQPSVVDEDKEKLPPIPIQIPLNLFDTGSVDDEKGPSADQPQGKGIISVLLMRSSHKLNDDDTESSDNGGNPGGFRSFVILKYLPKSLGNLFGFDESDSTDENKEKFGQKMLGGDDDVDSKRPTIHLLGGGGENDPDRLRFKIDEDKGVFTGNDDTMVNSNPIDQHRMLIFSMLDRIRNMFNNFEQQPGDQPTDDDSPPFIIRTDDGSAAIIPNDIGYAEKQQQSLNKCMMLNFMRLKASMYYRTILHLLFFTGVLLFILSLIMLTIRSYKRRRYVRHPMSISTIDASQNLKDSSKFNSYRAWNGGDLEQSIIGSDSKIVLIQAPPAYDQVIINDKTSSLTSSSQLFVPNNRCTSEDKAAFVNDDCETKSLPPDYEKSINSNN